MLHACRTILLITAALVGLASTGVLAAEGILLGTVQNVDPRQERLIVRARAETVVELRAPAPLLTGLKTGDRVEVQRSGSQVLLIRRLQGKARPELRRALLKTP